MAQMFRRRGGRVYISLYRFKIIFHYIPLSETYGYINVYESQSENSRYGE